MLVFICGYVASGHLWYSSAQGWLAILGYFLVAILDQRMLVGNMSLLKFFTLTFFLVSMNLIGMALAYTLERSNRLAFLQWLVIDRQHRESDRLLLNILPASVAERLKRREMVADHFDQVGFLFADIQGFTPYSADKRPAEVVEMLNEIFSAFDGLTEKYGLEKIKTIGDAYMAVSGLPSARPDHLEALANMALEMQAIMEKLRARGSVDFQLRIGVHAGPVVAGIIGLKKFSYDLWGDTVNVASRMESFGVPGEIQVTKEVYELLKPRYLLEKRGRVQIKGKGEMLVYLLKRCKEIQQAEALNMDVVYVPENAG
jgi:class 3 adenylate cyclase